MESALEEHRMLHEERERIENAMVRELIIKKNTHREHINSDHRIKYLLDKYTNITNKILTMYQDPNGTIKQEISSLQSNDFNEFYGRLKHIKDFYRNHPNEVAIPISAEYEKFVNERDVTEQNMVDFTDEEGYGKFLDLNHHFNQYINLKGIVGTNFSKIDYLTYLNTFDHFYDIPKDKKSHSSYQQYLESLIEYLEHYIVRSKPLLPLKDIVNLLKDDFEVMWSNHQVPGWPKETGGVLSMTGAPLDLQAFNSWEELASLGLDRLKSALVALGLKCGGTLEERAKRLWSTKGKSPDEIDPKLFAKRKGMDMNPEKQKEIAWMEVLIYKYIDILDEQRQSTKENVQRKQARTAGEREESEEEVEESEPEEEEETDVIYNPKNLPLGWDGKPIPYWLYKLHGLNIAYTCEICGNSIYKGPKAFQRHFAEWRHAHGMRCLGIPNTAHFANVTKIEDALALWEKLKNEKHKEKFQPSNEEEYEDSQGNVVNKKTYEDLKRQGLL